MDVVPLASDAEELRTKPLSHAYLRTMTDVTAQSLNDTLTRTGALRGIRAQLRDAVFKAIGGGDKPPPLKNPLGKDAQIALALIEVSRATALPPAAALRGRV